MRELERRRAEAEGRAPRHGPDEPGHDDGDEDADGGSGPGDDAPGVTGSGGPDADETPGAADREPTPIRRRPGGPRGRRSTPPPPRTPRPVGGPNDGEPPAWRVVLRRVGVVAAIVLVVFVLFL